LVSGVAGLIVIPNVARDNKPVSEPVTVRPVLNALFQQKNHVNVLKMNKLNVLQSQHAAGHLGATGLIAVAIVAIKPEPDPECVTVVINLNVRQRIRNAQDQILKKNHALRRQLAKIVRTSSKELPLHQRIQVIVSITTGPNGEFARHHLMVILAPILLDLEIVNAHVTVAMVK